MMNRIACRAVFLDAGGVIVLPDRRRLTDALARVGVEIDPGTVPGAHYRAARRLDCDPAARTQPDAYMRCLCSALGVAPQRLSDALGVMSELADRSRSDAPLWSEPTRHAQRTIAALQRAGIAVVIVTNSDGHGAENLRDAGIAVSDVIDSAIEGVAKPDPEIFRIALRRAGVPAHSTVHVGDMLSSDIAGARAAGIAPVHFDPHRACRRADHRHVRSLAGIWRHVAAPVTP